MFKFRINFYKLIIDQLFKLVGAKEYSTISSKNSPVSFLPCFKIKKLWNLIPQLNDEAARENSVHFGTEKQKASAPCPL